MLKAMKAVLRTVPTILVFGLLGVVGYWGHHSGWKAPKWSDIAGKPQQAEDWCKAHNVQNSRCIACHPELAGENAADWCKEHGVPESACAICHPEILTTGKAADWCKEHGVPESGCNLCHSDIVRKGELPKDATARAVTTDAESRATKDPLACRSHFMRVQFASPEAVVKAGVKLAKVEEQMIPVTLSVNGEVRSIPAKTARCSPRVAGSIFEVRKALGDVVVKGELLALVDAAEVGKAKSAFLESLALLDVKQQVVTRLRASTSEGFRSQAELAEAEAQLREVKVRLFAAQQGLSNLGIAVNAEDYVGQSLTEVAEKLKFIGLPQELLKDLASRTGSANLIGVTSPINGVLTAVDAVRGEVVDVSKPLFVVADTSTLWVALAVGLEDVSRLHLGQRVIFAPDGARDEPAVGQISWMSTAVDETTRMLEVRAEVPNPEGALRAGSFGKGRVVVRQGEKAAAIPVEAVNWEGCCYVAFVRLSDEIFQTRKIKLGVRKDGMQEILAGVAPGEIVAAEGSDVLRRDILRANLGAG